MLGAGDGFMSGLLKGWLTDAGLADSAASTPTPAAPSRSRATAAPRPIRPGRSCEFFLERGISAPGAAQRRGARADPLVDQPRAATLVRDAGLRLRPPHAARGDRDEPATPPSSIGAFKQLCLAGGAPGRRTAGPATASSATAGSAATRSTPPPAPASGSAGRCEWPGTRPLPLEPELGATTARARRMAASSTWSRCSVLLPSRTTTPAMRAEQEATVMRLVRRRPRATGWSSCSRSSRPRSAPVDDDTTARADPSASTPPGSIPTGGSSSR